MGWRPRRPRSDSQPRPAQESWLGTVQTVGSVLNHLSQVGLLVVAVVVYFYTVVPIYQKAVLDEDIAKRTIELKEINSKLAAYAGQVSAAQAELEQMHKDVAGARRQLAQTTKLLESAEAQRLDAQRQAGVAKAEAASAKRELEISITHLADVRRKLLTADERANTLYKELRAYVASRTIADMSSACGNPVAGFGSALLKEDPKQPRTVKLTDNVLEICISRQLQNSDVQTQIAKLSTADQEVFRMLIAKAAADAAPQVQAFLRDMHEREKKRRADPKLKGYELAELKDDEIPLTALSPYRIFSFVSKEIVGGLLTRDFNEQQRQQVAYSGISKKTLFMALDQFIKATAR